MNENDLAIMEEFLSEMKQINKHLKIIRQIIRDIKTEMRTR